MKLLVTGASGRIGRALMVHLSRTHDVRGLDRMASSTAHWVGDLADAALLQRALAGVDAVVHCAALHAPQVGQLPDAEFERVNVQATEALARAACAAGVAQVVYTSTTALYGAASTPAHAAALIRQRVPGLAAAFDARGWALPASIDRVYDPARAQHELGWQLRHGWAEVLRQLDDESPEVLPAGFPVAGGTAAEAVPMKDPCL